VLHIPIPAWASIGCLSIFLIFFVPFRVLNRPGPFWFDPQDAFRRDPHNTKFPKSAETATFGIFLTNYIDVMKLLITVAAASIAFGGNPHVAWQIVVAKSVLAWSILYGILFSSLLLYRYDEYAQDVRSYTANWYASIFALGFGSLICFIVGFMFWSWALAN
jgi:hypothetical protein